MAIKKYHAGKLDLTAEWNDSRSGTLSYTAPTGKKFVGFEVNEITNMNGSTYTTSQRPDGFDITGYVHGSNNVFDRRRGMLELEAIALLDE